MDAVRALTSYFAVPESVGPFAVPASTWGVGVAALQGINVFARAQYELISPMKYSKGASIHEDKLKSPIASRAGMFFVYFPALVASTFFVAQDLQNTVAALLVIHFAKRVLETLFLHKYGGNMDLEAVYTISIYYTWIAALFCYLTQTAPVPNVLANSTFQIAGLVTFAIGQSGNLYHHWLLAQLRTEKKAKDERRYVAPTGGMFCLVACPHYFFELLSFLGIAMVSQQFICFLEVLGQASYFAVRSHQANQLYKSQFDETEWPKSRKNLIPFVY